METNEVLLFKYGNREIRVPFKLIHELKGVSDYEGGIYLGKYRHPDLRPQMVGDDDFITMDYPEFLNDVRDFVNIWTGEFLFAWSDEYLKNHLDISSLWKKIDNHLHVYNRLMLSDLLFLIDIHILLIASIESSYGIRSNENLVFYRHLYGDFYSKCIDQYYNDLWTVHPITNSFVKISTLRN